MPSVERIIESCEQQQLTLDEIGEEFTCGGIHYKLGVHRRPTGFYAAACSCGWRIDTGKSAGTAHSLLRAHIAGHAQRVANAEHA